MVRARSIARVTAAALIAASATTAAHAGVVVEDIGTLGGTESIAGAINAHGLVVGCARDASGDRYAVAFDSLLGLRVLGTLDGAGILDCAQAVNDAGVSVGVAVSPDGFVAFRHDAVNGMVALPTLPGGFLQHVARGMNNGDLAVGWAIGGGNPQTPVVWENGAVAALPAPDGSNCFAVSDAGIIVGGTSDFEALRWFKDDGAWVVDPLGAPTVGPQAVAVGVAEDGTILGQMGEIFPSGPANGFAWNDGAWTTLPTPAGYDASGALDMNVRGEIIGGAFNGGGSTPAAVMWRDGAPIVLNDLLPVDSPWTLIRAWGINDRGQIAGEGTLDGAPRGYLLSPDCNDNGVADHLDIEGAPVTDVAHVPDWEGNGLIGGVTGSGVARDVAQTFTAGASGRLLAVRLAMRRTGANAIADGVSMPVEIVSTSGSLPNPNDVLGATTILSTHVPTSGTDLVTIDLRPAAVDLVAGTRYALLMRAPDVEVGEFDWLTYSPGQLPGADLASRNDGGAWVLHSADALVETVMRGAPTSVDENGDGIPDECAPACPADLDDSGAVGFTDLLLVLTAWGPCPPACPEDLDGSGAVGFLDLLQVLTAWGPCGG